MRSARCRPTVYVTDGPRSAAPAIDTRACCVSAFVRDEEPWKIVVPNSHITDYALQFRGHTAVPHTRRGEGAVLDKTKVLGKMDSRITPLVRTRQLSAPMAPNETE